MLALVPLREPTPRRGRPSHMVQWGFAALFVFCGRPALGAMLLGFGQAVPAFRGGGAAPTEFVLLLLELGCYLRGWAGFCFCFCLCGRPGLGAMHLVLGQALPAIAAGAPLPLGSGVVYKVISTVWALAAYFCRNAPSSASFASRSPCTSRISLGGLRMRVAKLTRPRWSAWAE